MKQKLALKLRALCAVILSACFILTVPSFCVSADETVSSLENSRYRLTLSDGGKAFGIYSAQSGEKLWSTSVGEDVFDTSSSTKTWKSYMNSILSITYAAESDNKGNFITSNSSDEENTVKITSSNKSIRWDITFAKPKISLAFVISLTDDGFKMSIPQDSVKESGKFRLVYVEPLPFFGAAAQNSNGYMLYPDGSGALARFEKTQDKNLYAQEAVLDVYGSVEHDSMFSKTANSTASLPVYGIKHENKAFLAAATKGDTDLQIVLCPAVNMASVPVNRASFRFVYRNQYRIYLSHISTSSTSTQSYGIKTYPEMIKQDRELRVFLLENEDANYSGMANSYRKFLTDNGDFGNKKRDGKIKLGLDIFMGIYEDSHVFKKYVEMTDFNKANDIIEDYVKSGVENIRVSLLGWNNSGYSEYFGKTEPSGKLGGKSGLKALSKYASSNKGLSLTLMSPMVFAEKSAWGLSGTKNCIQMKNTIPVSDIDNENYILTPERVLKNSKKVIKIADKFDVGVAYANLGNLIYHDASKRNTASRSQTAKTWQKICKNTKGNTSVEGANLYLLKYADYLFEIPDTSSGLSITDEDVPFLQMVLHGNIQYSTQKGNMTSDFRKTVLNWVENGAMPSFELSYNTAGDLKDTAYQKLFASKNSIWKERVTDTYKELVKRLSCVSCSFIVKHERIDENTVSVEYSSGETVVINYSYDDISYGGYTVKARDFAVIKQNGEGL